MDRTMSAEFKTFALKYGFEHNTSSPLYQQSNGLAEKAVQTTKKLIKKAKQDGKDIYLALLDLRNAPRNEIIGSPAQRLMDRHTKTQLPTTGALLRPNAPTPESVHEQLQKYRDRQKHY
jgi:hypothetical protein